MTDRVMRYKVEIDAAQARAQARQLAQDVQREMLAVQGSAVAAGAPAGTTSMSGGRASMNPLAALLGVGAGFAGAAFTAQTIRAFASEIGSMNVQVARSGQAFQVLSGGAAEAEKRLSAIQRASGNTMGNLEAMNLANRLVSLGMADSAAEMEKAVTTGRKIAFVMGGDVTSALENLSLAASNLSFMRLDQMGISAAQVRARMKELTDAHKELGKEQAFLQAALEVANQNFAGIDVSSSAAASGMERFTAAVQRAKEAAAGGPIGEAVNITIGNVGGAIDMLFGGKDAQLAETRRRFDAVQGGMSRWQASGWESWTPIGWESEGQGQSIASAYGALDRAIAAGATNLDAHQERIGEIADAWIKMGVVLPGSVRELEDMTRVLGATDASTSAYQRTLAILGKEYVENNDGARAVAGEMAKLDMLLTQGEITAGQYATAVSGLTVAIDMMADGMANASANADLFNRMMKQGSVANYQYIISGGATGAATGPLTREQAQRYNQTAYTNLPGQGIALDAYGAPQIDPKTGLRVRQPWAWDYVQGMNDGTLQGEWDSKVREQAAADRERIAREEEEAARKWQSAAEATQREMEAAAEKMARDFENKLSSIPGLLGTSAVTEDDMMRAKYGVYEEKPDEWLRQLADEVFNKKDHPNVDIGDAARRAGIAANLPPEAIYQMVASMWADSSLFAGGRNLDLVNQNAVRAGLARQDNAASGRAAVMAMFGIPDTQAVANAAASAGEAAGANTLMGPEAVADPAGMVANLQKQFATEEVAKSLQTIGDNIAGTIHQGFVIGVNTRMWTGPIMDKISGDAAAMALSYLDQALQ